jgi:hypothetical protein
MGGDGKAGEEEVGEGGCGYVTVSLCFVFFGLCVNAVGLESRFLLLFDSDGENGVVISFTNSGGASSNMILWGMV